jgi:hypothetical protein
LLITTKFENDSKSDKITAFDHVENIGKTCEFVFVISHPILYATLSDHGINVLIDYISRE